MIRLKSMFVKILSIVSVIFLVYILMGLILFRQQVFVYRNSLSLPEYFIGAGFLLILLTDLVSLVWLVQLRSNDEKIRENRILLVILGVLCIIFFMADKTMADEIGKQTAAGMGSWGEWIMLYAFLLIQMVYYLLTIRFIYKNGTDS